MEPTDKKDTYAHQVLSTRSIDKTIASKVGDASVVVWIATNNRQFVRSFGD